jgi:hypothetical protein
MTVAKQVKDLPLSGGGIDEGIDEKVLPQGRMLQLRNCYYEKPGRLVKRLGSKVLPKTKLGGGILSRGTALFSHKDELVLTDGNEAFAYSSTGAKSWVDKGAFSTPGLAAGVVISSLNDTANLDSWDSGAAGGVAVFVYGGGRATLGPVIATVVDTRTGTVLIAEQQLDTEGFHPHVIFNDRGIMGVAWSNLTGNDVVYAPLENAGTPNIAFGSNVIIVNNQLQASGVVQNEYKMAARGLEPAAAAAQQRFAVVYVNIAGEVILLIRNADGSAVSSTTTAALLTRAVWLSVNKNTGDIFVFYADTSAPRVVRYRPFDSSGSALGAAIVVDSIANHWQVAVTAVADLTTPSSMKVFWGEIDDGLPTAGPRETSLTMSAVVTNASAVSTAAAVFLGNIVPVSEAFTHTGVHYFFGVNMSGLLPSTGFLIDGNAGLLLRFYPIEATPSTFDSSMARKVSHLGNGDYLTSFLRSVSAAQEIISDTASSVAMDLARIDIDLNRVGNIAAIEANTSLNLAGGYLHVYDGDRITEAGFQFGPGAFYSINSIAGGSMANGNYELVAVYFWRDADGNEHYSRLGDITTHNNTNTTIRVLVANYRVTSRPGVKILVYRSLVGATGGPYYLAGSADNDTSTQTTQIDLTMNDANAQDNPTVYTGGGVLDNDSPPAPLYMWSDGQTAYLIAADDRRSLWVSKPISSRLAIEWSASLISRMPAGEELVAGGTIDANVILFSANSIRLLLGSPPTATGGGGYTQTRPISSDVGCVNARSVVVFRGGVLFKSSRGITLLDRSLQLNYIGGPVEDHNDAEILATCVIARSGIGHIRFLLDTGEVLVWDYILNAWSIFNEPKAACCVNWRGVYAAVDYLGGVRHKLDRSHYLDEDTPYSHGARWPWIKVAGYLGWQRTKRLALLGEYRSRHTAAVAVYNGYNGLEPAQRREFSLEGDAGDAWKARLRVAQQKAETLAIDVDIEADGPGLALTSLSLEIGAKKGLAKLSKSASG